MNKEDNNNDKGSDIRHKELGNQWALKLKNEWHGSMVVGREALFRFIILIYGTFEYNLFC